MNARLDARRHPLGPEVNIGLAVDSARGLLVPVLRGAQRMGVKEIAIRFRELVARAREGRAGPGDLSGGTFTITNLGMFGVDSFTPIINLPECAILGVGRIRPEPAVVDGQVVVRQRLWLSLTFDHRLVDGARRPVPAGHRPLHRNAVPVAGVGHTTQQRRGRVGAPLAPRDLKEVAMVTLFGRSWTRDEILRHVGSLSQVGGCA